MMKSWHSLNQQLAIWRQRYHHQRSLLKNNQQPKTKLLWRQNKSHQKNWQKIHFCDSVVTLFLAIVLLTGVVGYRFYNQPQLTVDKISPVTIKAPETASFEDVKTTLQKRQEVKTGVTPILKQNQKITSEINTELNQYIAKIEVLRDLNRPFPFVNPQIISSGIQQYLRSCSETEFNLVFQPLLNKKKAENFLNSQKLAQIELTRKAIAELIAYRQKNSNQDFLALLTKIKAARTRYSQGWETLQQKPIGNFSVTEISPLLDLNDLSWDETKNTLQTATERILTQGIPPGMPTEILAKVVDLQLGDRFSSAISHWSSKLLLEILRPNLEPDREATLNLAEKAAEEIEPIRVSIEKGATIVTQGNVISQTDFVLLDGFGLSRRSINWLGLQTSTAIVIVAIAIFLFCQKQTYLTLRHRDYLLLCFLAISAPIIAIFQVTHPNLPAIGLLISSFYHPFLAVCHVSLVTGLIFFSNPAVNWEYLLAASAGGLMTGAIAGRLRSREAISKLGVSVGLVQGGAYFLFKMIVSPSAGIIWSAVLPDAIIYGLSGVAWCIVALGISPYLEKFFDVVTPIRLAELSNPNLPLLKRLATEAPGTFQHTMFVASLAESAARALNCNVELVRAGTLYHDIGKMHDPLGFIENQMGNPNKHDSIDDPWVSAEIIKKHVTEGLVMAKKYGLPKAIRDFIPQHQGTLLIAYFYHQAKQKSADNRNISVLEADFRYEGPIPQSREAGIMMLADGCEAALRSLKDITPEQALITVKKIFKARWQDQQLMDSGLKYEELPIIAEVFVRVWQQVNHKRIIYPKDSN
jgi:cyclic-di-AMP phosphodiesterase PgpH